MSEIPAIDRYDPETWHKVDAYLESQVYTAKDVSFDFSGVDWQEEGMYLNGTVSVLVPAGVYRKPEPPSPETLELQRLRDLAERALRALNEDDFPQLRQDLRDALGTT